MSYLTSSIGTTGRDYSTVAAWEADTDNDLVAAANGEHGILYDDSTFTLTSGITISGAVVSATYQRALRVAVGEEYDPSTDTGVQFDLNYSSAIRAFTVAEDYFEMTGPFKISNAAGTTATDHIEVTTASNCTFDSIFHLPNSTGLTTKSGQSIDCNRASESGNVIRNIVFSDPDDDWANIAITVGSSTQVVAVKNCTFYGGSLLGANATSSSNCTAENVVSVAPSSSFNDFYGGWDTGASSTNNASNDTSSPGGSSQDSIVVADTWTDAANSDLTVKDASSALADNGTDLSGEFTKDVILTTRTGTWDIGAFDFVGSGSSGSPWNYYQQCESAA